MVKHILLIRHIHRSGNKNQYATQQFMRHMISLNGLESVESWLQQRGLQLGFEVAHTRYHRAAQVVCTFYVYCDDATWMEYCMTWS